ncbi:MAG: error-prone DNA polymerase [Gammaproteobacteria bacterium]|nr:error-prone DNA polymerase [Gammaproteobacteria bacterium]MCP5137296.1 error-prone DNA polymerase [Gammaproteobacteria bacterium]
MSAYVELHCLSNLSFLRGASHPEELVVRAVELGYAGLAITDECSVSGVVRAHEEAREHGLKLIVGAELRVDAQLKIVVLARDRLGYGHLSELISHARRAADKGEYALDRDDLIGLRHCLLLWLPETEPDVATGEWLAARFAGRCWLGVELFGGADDGARLERLQALGKTLALPLVAAGDVHMHVAERQALQDTLTAIRLNTPLADCGYALFPNAERHLRPLDRLHRIHPPELLAATLDIAKRCHFSLDELRYEYPEELIPPGETPASHLRRLALDGLAWRYPDGIPGHARELVEKELALIAELEFEPYFLTVHDLVRFARSRDILCQGRGSAANSAVCYVLGITEVDPARMAMLFERFLSKERREPPDIDVDFEHQRREEVIQYVYAKYGRERAALAAVVIRYKPRSAIRDVGRALALDEDQIARLSASMQWWDGRQVQPERLIETGFDPANPLIERLAARVNEIIGTPRHLSQHVGGFVIARDKLTRLVPVENARMPERTVIQWEKDDLEALGLLKIDVLALGMLSAIRRALDLLGMQMSDIPPEDPAVYDMISHADTLGVFQIESRAQMAMLPRLRPRRFYDLVIEVAIVRPGPIQGDMVHPYLRRRQGIEPVRYPSDAVKSVLERTLGVPIFQEQVMQLAMVAAGFSAGEADQLRRAMAAWKRRGGLEPFERKLIDGMRERGYSDDFAQAIFRQIRGFGEYGFPESHAASFALLVYVSAWLKKHHPAVFACALLNAQPMGFYAPAQLVADARRHGVEVLPVDVCTSDWDCTLEAATATALDAKAQRRGGRGDKEAHGKAHANKIKPALRLGLRLIRGLSEDGAKGLIATRRHTSFSDIQDLARRTGLRNQDLDALAAAGALASLTGDRHQARWAVTGIDTPTPLEADLSSPSRLRASASNAATVDLPMPTQADDLIADYASVGLTLGPHPLTLLRPTLTELGFRSAAEVLTRANGRPVHACGIVINRQRPGSAGGVIFTTLEDETGMLNVVVWQRVIEAQRKPLLSARLLGVHGTLERADGVTHLIAGRLEDLTHLLGGLMTPSRDFQ